MKSRNPVRSITALLSSLAKFTTPGAVTRRTGWALLAGLLAATAAMPASATLIFYGASLSGAQENPPVMSAGTGLTTVTYDDVAHTLRLQVPRFRG